MKTLLRKKLWAMMIILMIMCGYIIWENNRIVVVEESIPIRELPEDLEGFTIVQITDLHEKVFGKEQSKLINMINSINYDAIVFTGDMLVSPESNNYAPFYTLIEGIRKKNIAYFVPGNTDPQSFIIGEKEVYERDRFIKGMEERGIKLLDTIEKVKVGSSNLYFTYFENSIALLEQSEQDKKLDPYIERLLMLEQYFDSEVLIALNHYPIPDDRIDLLKEEERLWAYDLLIAGHYHGGQIRLPFIGAVFIPEPYYLWDGFFPPQDRVKGLWNYNGIQQYVSTGLGSSDAISFLNFRFYNPPEVNVLTLKKK
ncbi:phosphoesterase [Robertmurraya siralis]|uniref:Phosphoesterase n=1 Tax=Robertmurraya siralis TaxID=77777 RepID=A0A919WHA9_9BACI|nr:metallophosphoesterase [Robertmurraya siralis]PAE18661.1 hypothetical protein CHH80_20470 [Bacillus sp. 7504-2]GIN61991.1 phosphoesterase [Robertmurraya siralis]